MKTQRLSMFQSSPGPEARCYVSGPGNPQTCSCCFNPHRARRPGATFQEAGVHPSQLVSILTGPGGPVLRARGQGRAEALYQFQSSPGPEARCYHAVLCPWHAEHTVSILTGPGGPVLPC